MPMATGTCPEVGWSMRRLEVDINIPCDLRAHRMLFLPIASASRAWEKVCMRRGDRFRFVRSTAPSRAYEVLQGWLDFFRLQTQDLRSTDSPEHVFVERMQRLLVFGEASTNIDAQCLLPAQTPVHGHGPRSRTKRNFLLPPNPGTESKGSCNPTKQEGHFRQNLWLIF